MNTLDKFTLVKDVYLFCRQLTFKLLYHHPSPVDNFPNVDRQVLRDLMDLLQENENTTSRRPFTSRLPSQSTPSLALFPAVHIFFMNVCRDIQNLPLDTLKNQNLSKDEYKALLDLQRNKDFLIREADKGGNIVLWPNSLYLQEVMRQLQATPCYTRLPADPSEVFKKRLDVLIGQALRQGTINKKEADFLTTDDPIVPTFYLLPKAQKKVADHSSVS
ncbi:uncharacterized protein [Dendrobates tinctorius]|uniref:uncharacterized protein n=1 Tax=Dendrobates tinctorius TaxID=92724 RepID=UPI003CCA24E0